MNLNEACKQLNWIQQRAEAIGVPLIREDVRAVSQLLLDLENAVRKLRLEIDEQGIQGHHNGQH